jgi:hypothetical protein
LELSRPLSVTRPVGGSTRLDIGSSPPTRSMTNRTRLSHDFRSDSDPRLPRQTGHAARAGARSEKRTVMARPQGGLVGPPARGHRETRGCDHRGPHRDPPTRVRRRSGRPERSGS